MLDLSRIFISEAVAQTLGFATNQPAADPQSGLAKYIPLGIIALVVYFLFFHKKKK